MTTKYNKGATVRNPRRISLPFLFCLLFLLFLFKLMEEQDVRGVWCEKDTQHQIVFTDQGDAFFDDYRYHYTQKGNKIYFWTGQEETRDRYAWFFRWGDCLFLQLDFDGIGGKFYDEIGWAELEFCY